MHTFTCWAKALVCALLLCFFSSTLAQSLFGSPYSHYSDNEQLPLVLSDFARSQGYTPVVSPKIQGTLSGRFDQVEPDLFLDGLYSAFGVCYYINDQTIYFYHDSETVKSMFRPANKDGAQLLTQLKQAQIVTPSLPVTVSSNGMLVISGPSQYVNQVIATAQQLDQSADFKPVIKVFRLKHAKAEDIQVQSSERSVTIPGIASILQSMVGGSSGPTKVSVTQNSAVLQGLMGSGLASTGTSARANSYNSGLASLFSGVNNQSMASNSSNGLNQVQPLVISSSSNAAPTYSPTIIADSRLNAVIIQDAQYRMSYYSQVITELDVPVKLIELHAAIVDVDVDSSRSLGVDWSAARRSGNWGFGANSGNVQWDGSLPAPGVAGGGIFSTVFETGHSSVMMQINALEQNNKARTLGKPSVLTMDNIEATLEDTTTRYVPVAGYQDTDLFKVESGTVLRVTPHIVDTGDDALPLIQMQITLQSNQDNTSDYSTVDSEGNIQLPPIKQTKLNTQAVVREGQSLLIGGYFVQYQKGGDSGIPTLKDAPVVGGLFGSDSENTYTRERLLIITPHILSLDELNVPRHADYEQFSRAPTSVSYEQRPVVVPEEERSGCSSTRNSSPDKQQPAQQPQPIPVQGQMPVQVQPVNQVQPQAQGTNQVPSSMGGYPPPPLPGGLSPDVAPQYQVVYSSGSNAGAPVFPQ